MKQEARHGQARSGKRWITGLSLGLGLVLLGPAYLVGAYFWMLTYARKAGVSNPTTPYLETIPGQGSHGSITVTVLGDSTAIGVGSSSRRQTFSYQVIRAAFLSRYSQIYYVNRGVSGARLADVLAGQLLLAVQDQPDWVFISIGANDVTGRTTPEEFQKHLRTLLDTLTRQTKARIVLLGVPAVLTAPLWRPLLPPLVDFQTHRLIGAEKAVLPAYPVLAVDLYSTTKPVFAAHPELFAADLFHPNDQGYGVWATEVLKVIAKSP